MRNFAGSAAGLMLFCLASVSQAGTLTVTTDKDEANCRSEAGCSTLPNGGGEAYPNSTGCSLREALQDVADVAGAQAISFPECGTPDTVSNTIELGVHAIQIFSAVKDPADITGAADKHYGVLPFITDSATAGTLTINNGALSCEYDPNSNPVIGGNAMITTANGAKLTFNGTSFSNCTAPADGVAIVNSGNTNGDLNLLGTAFTNIHATNQGNGGCISHGSGNLTITGGSFTACIIDDGTAIPGSGGGKGGAIFMTNAGGTSRISISGVTFQGNIAGNSGGALYLSSTDAVAITNSAFQGNIARGSTFDSGDAERGGGAIYALNTATGENDGTQQGINASAFLIFQTAFTANLAPSGTGGAILLSGGNLRTGTLTINLGDYLIGKAGIPGGIVASNFSANVAGGSWDMINNAPLDPRAGSGGAVYANGNLEVYASSFVGANSSTNASGGAIAYEDAGARPDPMRIFNTTINGNTAGTTGGGIALIPSKFTQNVGKLTLINDTIAGNSATGAGGGVFNANTTAADIKISNTILANNTATAGNENCGGQPVTNVIGNLQFNPDATCSDMPVGDPELAAAAPFGGVNALVFVMQIGDTSAANGIGDQTTCDGASISDRDEALRSRPQGKPSCDAGAYEAASLTPVTLQSFDVE